jgi:hypothetical protein
MGDVIEVLTAATNTVEVEAAGPQGTPGVGVPTGGSALQVLRKASSTDYDTEWSSSGGGSVDLSSPDPIGDVTPNTGAFTTLSASSTVNGTGFSTYLASPPAIGGTAPAAITGTTITATNYVGISGGTF